MTVPVPVTLTTIQAAGWGAIVASDVNGLLARTTALEGINAGPRLGAAEAEIDALTAQAARIGAQRTKSGTVLIPGDGNPFTVPFATEDVTPSGITYNAGVFTIGTAGVYAGKAYVALGNGHGTVIGWTLNWNGEGIPGPVYGGNWFLADMVGYLPAGATVRFQVTRSNTGTTGAVDLGRLNIWRVAAT